VAFDLRRRSTAAGGGSPDHVLMVNHDLRHRAIAQDKLVLLRSDHQPHDLAADPSAGAGHRDAQHALRPAGAQDPSGCARPECPFGRSNSAGRSRHEAVQNEYFACP